jgi:mannosyltransferase OCH1-like enzyme
MDRLKLNREPAKPLVRAIAPGDCIPKIIHQTYHARPWPAEYEANAVTLQRVNPGWSYRFYDYEDRVRFIGEHYGDAVLQRYEAIDANYGAARADLFRYLLLYREGGVYLDMKSCTSRPLDEVIREDDRFILSTWRSGELDDFPAWGRHRELNHLPFGEYQQWNIIAAPGHPFLKRVIEFVLRNIDVYVKGLHGVGPYAVFRVTGPVAYTLAIEPIRASAPFRLVDGRRELGLVYSIFDHDTTRSHEQRFAHYARLRTPLARMTVWRSAISNVISFAKSGLHFVRRSAA